MIRFNMKLLTIALIIGVNVLWACPCNGERISEILRAPDFYNSKQVRLTGITRGDRIPFEIYADEKSAREMKSSNAIWVIMHRAVNERGPYDLRRVELTGVIDSTQHGTWGKNPCSIVVQRLRVLSGPVAKWPDTAVVIKNVTGNRLFVAVKDKSFGHSFELAPGEHEAQYINGESTITANGLTGVLRAKANVIRPPDGSFFDSINGAIYYQITGAKIEMVPAATGQSWGWHR